MFRFLTIAGLFLTVIGGLNFATQLSAQITEKGTPFAHVLDPTAPNELLPAYSKGKFHPAIQGVWMARGYGFLVEIGEQDFHWFSRTKNHMWEHTPDEPLDMKFAIEESSGRCYLKPFDTEAAYILERIESLPPGSSQPPKTDPRATLEQINEIMTAHFPFFEVRNHDWAKRMKIARTKVNENTSEEALFEVMDQLFVGLNDGHTSLTAEIDGEARSTTGAMSSIRKSLEAAFAAKKDMDRGDFFGQWSELLFSGIKDELLGGKAKTDFDEAIIWGKVNPKVGYLFVRNMFQYYGDNEEDLAGGLERLHTRLEEITDEFTDCDAIIIDVTINRGGFHSIAMAFASHIADQQRYAFCKHPYRSPDLLQKFDIVPFQNSAGEAKTFTKQVYILASDATVSAGEEFILAARVFPHVKIIGKHTNGMLSDMLEKPLPNGWSLSVSNEVFLDHKGKCFEAVGIPVDIARPIFDLDDIESVGHAKSIRQLADEIAKGKTIQ